MEGFARGSFLRETVNAWDFSGLKDIFQVFNQIVFLSRNPGREKAVACLSEGWGMLWQRVESSAMR